jgi:D-tyrosyl-tRNA(Tyr) deacylase
LRALVQRVRSASVLAGEAEVASIGPGMLVLAGIRHGDTEAEADRLGAKIRALRIFDDADGRMNEPLGEREILCVSQFTLYADTSRGNRPSYTAAAPAEVAQPLYEHLCEVLGAARGAFGEHMTIELTGDGPVTVMLEA